MCSSPIWGKTGLLQRGELIFNGLLTESACLKEMIMLKMFEILEERESPYNGKIQAVKTLEGVKLVVDGVSQSGWLVKRVWKRALEEIKRRKPEVEKVLVLGLGGGSVTGLVSKHWPAAKIIGVDIDPDMVDLGRKYLSLSDVKNLEFVVADAEKWIGKQKQKFDLALVDLYKGSKMPEQFRQPPFIQKVNRLLESGGIAAFNHLYSYDERKDALLLEQEIRKVFPVIIAVTPEANIIFIAYKA